MIHTGTGTFLHFLHFLAQVLALFYTFTLFLVPMLESFVRFLALAVLR